MVDFLLFEAKMATPESPVSLFVQRRIERNHEIGRPISEAHNTPHLRNTAKLSRIAGGLLGFSQREIDLTVAACWLHDLIRSPSEDPGTKDNLNTAVEADRILRVMNVLGSYKTTQDEKAAIVHAIQAHGSYPQWLANTVTRNNPPQELKDKLHLALFVADKMEANGVRVIARRSSFVAGDRLHGPEGDWRTLGFIPDKDESLVVAIESMIRLTFINPEEVYPEALQPLVHPLYEVQREFVLGLCKKLNLTVEDLVRWLIETKRADSKNILEARNIQAPQTPGELVTIINVRGGITNGKIAAVNDDQAASAVETVLYFSRRYKEDLDELVRFWQPTGETARRWQQGMIEYIDGTWFRNLEQRFSREETHQ